MVFRERFLPPFRLDLRSLALFRIGLGSLLLADLARRAGDLEAFYTDQGVLPRALVWGRFFENGVWSLHLLSGEVWVQGFLFLIAGVFALMLLTGYRTRLAAGVSWALLLSLQNRAPMILNGGDELLRHLLLWSVFLPLGACFSADRALDSSKSVSSPRPAGFSHESIATVALVCQVGAVYGLSALLKTGAEWQIDGTALYYALNIDGITTPLGRWLLGFQDFWGRDLLKPLTFLVFFLEALAPLLLLIPFQNPLFRLLAVGILAGLNLAFAVSFHLGIFPWVNLVALIALIPGKSWQWILKIRKPTLGQGLTLVYDGDCRFCEKAVRVFQTLLVLPEAVLLPAQHDPRLLETLEASQSWIVRDEAGKLFFKTAALRECLKRSPWLSPFSRLLPDGRLLALADRLYDGIARRRALCSRLTGWLALRPASPEPGIFSQALVTFLLVYTAVVTALIYEERLPSLPQPLITLAVAGGLGQSWPMFAPFPLKADGWYVARGQRSDGIWIDPLNDPLWGSDPVRPLTEKPPDVAALYSNERWAKWMIFLTFPDPQPALIRSQAEYLCRRWNRTADRTGTPRLLEFTLYFILEETPPPGHKPTPHPLALWHQSCTLF